MRSTYQIVLTVEVFDFELLRAAAKAEAMKSMSAEAWEELRSENLSSVAADLHMLFDPGVSPSGCQIEDGVVEFVTGTELQPEGNAT